MRNRISEYSDFATEHVDVVLTLYTFIQKVPGYPDVSFFVISHSLCVCMVWNSLCAAMHMGLHVLLIKFSYIRCH